MVIAGLILLIVCFFFFVLSLELEKVTLVCGSLGGIVLSFLIMIVGAAADYKELSEQDCQSFKESGAEAYMVSSSCYVKIGDNVFTQTRGKDKQIRSRSWVEGHSKN